MGFNSIHLTGDNYVECVNLTNGATFFASIKTNHINKMQVVQRVQKNKVVCVLTISGYAEINVNDLIQVPSFKNPLKVEAIDDSKDQILFRRRIDYADFTGDVEVALS